MMNVLFLGSLLLTFLVTGSATFHNHHHDHQVILKDGHQFVLQFGEETNGNTKVLISPYKDSVFTSPMEFFRSCENTLEMTKNMVSGTTHEVTNKFQSLEQQAKEVIENAVEKVGDVKGKLCEKTESVARNAVEKIPEMFRLSESTKGALKDNMVKMQQWDAVDSPRRIGEDIEGNASKQVEKGIEEVKETVENIKKSSLSDLLQRSRKLIHDLNLLEKIGRVISWCHLLGFSTAYGMGMWVTFFSRCVLGKCNLDNQQVEMLVNKMNLVYFRAMAYCVGAAVFGYVLQQSHDQGRNGVVLSSNKMEMFQKFNLLYALFMILTNLIFLEPQTTKLIVERTKMEKAGKAGEHTTGSKVAEKLKKLNAYSSTLNASIMVVLTWHLAYIGRLIQAAGC